MSADLALLRALQDKPPAERARITVVLTAIAALEEDIGTFHRLVATVNPARLVNFADAVHHFIEKQAPRYDRWIDAAFFANREFLVAVIDAEILADWRRDAASSRPAERVPEYA